MITTNPNYFREVALYHNKYKRYPDGEWDSYEYHEFWEREEKRCLEGFKVGDMSVTGYHYWYLNHWPILLTRSEAPDLYAEVFKDRVHGTREFEFPDFWDVDWEFFNEFELAIINGQHFLVLKPRGTGFSNKGASIVGRNYHLIPRSKGYFLADNKEFLEGDGIFNKFLDGRNFLNRLHPEFARQDKVFHNAFGKTSDYKKDKTGMHFKASLNSDGTELGYESEVMGIAIDGETDKARGKRGQIIILEELGAMRKAETVHNVVRNSVEEVGITYGTILGFGTGGTVSAVFGDLEKMFYAPEAYNIRAFPNKWDEGMHNTFCSFFTPAYRSVGYKDKFGNSNEKLAKSYWDVQREKAEKSPDQNAITQVKAENPYTPQEAILRNTYSVLPSAEARDWLHMVQAQGLVQVGVPGKITPSEGGLIFKPSQECKPIYEYPHNTKNDLTGCVVQYYAPHRIGGQVPENLYIISLDPYAFDQSTDSQSIGAAYVYMQPNNIAPPGDRIVATYFGRPKTQDDFNRVLFDLAIYYNAKIGFENDRGNTIDYAKRFKLLDYLAEEFELAFDADLPKSKVKRGYGMHIGSGKENLRMHKGNMYLRDWLISPRTVDEHGKERWNLHTIFCPATLKEIDLYRPEGGNFDRIAALRILAYHRKELVYKEQKPIIPINHQKAKRSFWQRKHFA
jgi:hypothetical protein